MNITSFNKITINKIVVCLNDVYIYRQEELKGIEIYRKTTSLPFYANGQNHVNLLDLNRFLFHSC